MERSNKKLIILSVIIVLIALLIFSCADNVIYYFNFDLEEDLLHMDSAMWYIVLNDFENLAHVRMIELKHNFEHDTRSEYRFEVIEWIKGGNSEKNISAYSPKKTIRHGVALSIAFIKKAMNI